MHNIALVAHDIAGGTKHRSTMALNAAMDANPIGILILAITGLIAIGVLLWKNWDKISAFAVEIWNGIKDFFVNIWEKIKTIFSENWDKILAILFPAIGLPILIARHWDEIKEYIQGLWDKITDIVSGWWENIKDFFKKMNPWEWMKKGWDALRDGIGGILKKIFGGSDVEDWADSLNQYLSSYDLSGAGETMFGSLKTGIDQSLDETLGSVSNKLAAAQAGMRPGEWIATNTESMRANLQAWTKPEFRGINPFTSDVIPEKLRDFLTTMSTLATQPTGTLWVLPGISRLGKTNGGISYARGGGSAYGLLDRCPFWLPARRRHF